MYMKQIVEFEFFFENVAFFADFEKFHDHVIKILIFRVFVIVFFVKIYFFVWFVIRIKIFIFVIARVRFLKFNILKFNIRSFIITNFFAILVFITLFIIIAIFVLIFVTIFIIFVLSIFISIFEIFVWWNAIFSWKNRFLNFVFSIVVVWRLIRFVRFFFVFFQFWKKFLKKIFARDVCLWRFLVSVMIITFEIKELIFFIKFIIIEFKLTIINLMSRVFFVFELFQKKNDWNNFFESFNVSSDFRSYDIKSSNKLIILIANINRFRVFHDRKNEIWNIFMIFYIVQKIFFFRKFLKSENHWLSKFFDKNFASVICFFVKKAKCLFFQITKILDVSYLNCFT